MSANNIVRRQPSTISLQSDCSGGTSDTYGVLSGLVNSSNTVYTVSLGSYVSGSLKVYLNGQLQTQGSSEDWVETTPASGTFTFATAPATGDIIIASYQYTTGATGNADTLDGLHASSFPQFTDLDMCYVQKNSAGSNQTISNNTNTALTFDSEVFDTNTMHDNSTNPSRVTIKKDGYYLINGAIRWETTNSGGYSRKIMVFVNGSEIATNIMLPVTTSATSAPSQVITTTLYLTTNQYVELYVYQDSGGNLDISRWIPHTYLQVARLR